MADSEQAKGGGGAATVTESPLLDTILSKGMRARDDLQRSHATGILGEFVRKISEGYIAPSKDVVAPIHHTTKWRLRSGWTVAERWASWGAAAVAASGVISAPLCLMKMRIYIYIRGPSRGFFEV